MCHVVECDVAYLVAVGVVEFLEVVDVDHRQAEAFAGLFALGDLFVEVFGEGSSVRYFGESIFASEMS